MSASVALGAQEQQVPKWIFNYKENKQRRARGTQTVSPKVTAELICRPSTEIYTITGEPRGTAMGQDNMGNFILLGDFTKQIKCLYEVRQLSLLVMIKCFFSLKLEREATSLLIKLRSSSVTVNGGPAFFTLADTI